MPPANGLCPTHLHGACQAWVWSCPPAGCVLGEWGHITQSVNTAPLLCRWLWSLRGGQEGWEPRHIRLFGPFKETGTVLSPRNATVIKPATGPASMGLLGMEERGQVQSPATPGLEP